MNKIYPNYVLYNRRLYQTAYCSFSILLITKMFHQWFHSIKFKIATMGVLSAQIYWAYFYSSSPHDS